ncbi:peptidase S28 family protein [Abortiporus biennis]
MPIPSVFLVLKDDTPMPLDSKYSEANVEDDFLGFRGHWFRQPLDHFDKSNHHTWRQRYWINTRHYKPNTSAPVIVLDGGETSGTDRLPFLDTGIVEILTKATGGVGVVLEHRYYGRSLPVSNLTTDSLRWLNNDQSAADSANFIANVKFPGIEEDLTAPGTAWIYYGGSYAGARAAHMKVLYPDLVYGAIASSGVTHASIENWEYFDIIRLAADPKCSAHLVKAIQTIDTMLSLPHLRRSIKNLFGLVDLEHDEDFVSLIRSPLGAWQSKNWDPKVGSVKFDEFCAALDKPLVGKDSEVLNVTMFYDHDMKMVTLSDGLQVDLSVFNYAKYIKERYVSKCPEEFGVEDCFGTFDDSKFQGTSIFETWRLWIFQVCTEWGYFSTAPPPEVPRIVSKLLTLEYESMICQQAFPPGEHMVVPPMPNITAVNVLGDFDIAADRLAIIDGEVDPWKPCTPHSRYASDREDTILRPFKVIPNGVHHYDEFGMVERLEVGKELIVVLYDFFDIGFSSYFINARLDACIASRDNYKPEKSASEPRFQPRASTFTCRDTGEFASASATIRDMTRWRQPQIPAQYYANQRYGIFTTNVDGTLASEDHAETLIKELIKSDEEKIGNCNSDIDALLIFAEDPVDRSMQLLTQLVALSYNANSTTIVQPIPDFVVPSYFLTTTLVAIWLACYLFIILTPIISFGCPYKTSLLGGISSDLRVSLNRIWYRRRWRSQAGFYRFPGDEQAIRRDYKLDTPALIQADQTLNDDVVLLDTLEKSIMRTPSKDMIIICRQLLSHRLDRDINDLRDIHSDEYSMAQARGLRAVVDILSKAMQTMTRLSPKPNDEINDYRNEALTALCAIYRNVISNKRGVDPADAILPMLKSLVHEQNEENL